MKNVFYHSYNIVSPLGNTALDNFQKTVEGISGIKCSTTSDYLKAKHCIADFETDIYKNTNELTRFESLVCEVLNNLISNSSIDYKSSKTLFILSTTKGNIELLDEVYDKENPEIRLSYTAEKIAKRFGFYHKPIVVSNACISGLVAQVVAKRYLENGLYDHAFIVGADVLSRFIVSGFHSLRALSDEKCKPFDKDRSGINLGSAAAGIVLTTNQKHSSGYIFKGGAITNDANHLSAPSRTGEELAKAIELSLEQAQLSTQEIDYISAHGTATIYNDEMEAKAISLAGLSKVPTNSLKGYFGHTLGASGVMETIMTIMQMEQSIVLSTVGFEELGVSESMNIISTNKSQVINHALKLTSGFGGSNAAIVIGKEL